MKKTLCHCTDPLCNDLALEYLSGDSLSGNKLILAFQVRVQTIVTRVLGPSRREDWDDATQTATLQGLLSIPKWRQECPFCCYYLTVVSRKCIDYVRHIDSHRRVPLRDEYMVQGVSTTGDAEFLSCYRLELQKLPCEYQHAWTLHLDGVSVHEIACQLKLSERTVFYRLATVRSQMANSLCEFEPRFKDSDKISLQQSGPRPSFIVEGNE